MTPDPIAPRPILDQEAVWTHLHHAIDQCTPLAIWTAVGDLPVVLAEVERLTTLLGQARMAAANLLAAAQATLAAQHDGEADPLFYLRDEVAAHQAPPRAEDHR